MHSYMTWCRFHSHEEHCIVEATISILTYKKENKESAIHLVDACINFTFSYVQERNFVFSSSVVLWMHVLTLTFFLRAAKNIWKKKFFEEKRKTAALEEQVNRLRHEVDAQHKTLMSYLESKGNGPLQGVFINLSEF